MRATRKKRSSMKERTEAPRMRPSQPPILAERRTKKDFVGFLVVGVE